jgi:hypothetical protein
MNPSDGNTMTCQKSATSILIGNQQARERQEIALENRAREIDEAVLLPLLRRIESIIMKDQQRIEDRFPKLAPPEDGKPSVVTMYQPRSKPGVIREYLVEDCDERDKNTPKENRVMYVMAALVVVAWIAYEVMT